MSLVPRGEFELSMHKRASRTLNCSFLFFLIKNWCNFEGQQIEFHCRYLFMVFNYCNACVGSCKWILPWAQECWCDATGPNSLFFTSLPSFGLNNNNDKRCPWASKMTMDKSTIFVHHRSILFRSGLFNLWSSPMFRVLHITGCLLFRRQDITNEGFRDFP